MTDFDNIYWDWGPRFPTAREQLLQEIVASHRDAERIARRRRLRRKAQRRKTLYPLLLGVVCIIILLIGCNDPLL